MNHITKVKILYALYSPFQNIKLALVGVKTKGIVFTGGCLFVNRSRQAVIHIGRQCRFMSKWWGNNIGLNHPCMLSAEKGAKLTIGDHCSFSGVSIWCFNSITLGNHVRVGANCLIMDGDAHQDDPRSGKNKPIIIEDNVWLGGSVTVLKGVTIGRNSLIGYGSIVTKDIPANVIAAGNPCKVIRELSDDVITELEAKYKV